MELKVFLDSLDVGIKKKKREREREKWRIFPASQLRIWVDGAIDMS